VLQPAASIAAAANATNGPLPGLKSGMRASTID